MRRQNSDAINTSVLQSVTLQPDPPPFRYSTSDAETTRRLLVEELTLNPIQKYKTQNRFPYQILLTGLIVLCSTAQLLTLSYSQNQQHRQVQHFFNVNLLKHSSFDIYEGEDVFTWRTQEYKTLPRMTEFFDNLIKTMQGLSQLNYAVVNETLAREARHVIRRQFKDGTRAEQNMTLEQIVEDRIFSRELKGYMNEVYHMNLYLSVYNITNSFQKSQLHVKIDLEQRFTAKIEIDLVLDKNIDQIPPHGVGIRKVPVPHHVSFNPFRVSFVGSILLIILTLQSIFRRYFLYKASPFQVPDITHGQPFHILTTKSKIEILGVWNLIIVILNIGAILCNSGLCCFLCWIQLSRYLEYSGNPLLFTNMMRKVLPVQLSLLLNIFFVLSGFVMFSMLVFTASNKKFQSVVKAYYQYLFNNYQYGIYENFLAIMKYGIINTLMYLVLLFYMVLCATNMITSIMCNAIINKSRYNSLKEELRSMKFTCPVCGQQEEDQHHQTDAYIQRHSLHRKQSEQFEIQVLSPKLIPFLQSPQKSKLKMQVVPVSSPSSNSPLLTSQQKPEDQKLKKKRKKTFIIIQDSLTEGAPVTTHNIPSILESHSTKFDVFSKRLEFSRKRFEECVLQIEVYSDRKNKAWVLESLRKHHKKFNRIVSQLLKEVHSDKILKM